VKYSNSDENVLIRIVANIVNILKNIISGDFLKAFWVKFVHILISYPCKGCGLVENICSGRMKYDFNNGLRLLKS